MRRIALLALAVSCAEPAASRRAAPVINGDPALPGEFEATGALILDGQVLCTGTLIAPDIVLTAGHCVDEELFGDLLPGFTLAIDAREASADEVVAGRAKLAHPDYDFFELPPDGVGRTDDIGLLLLAEPIDGPTEQLPTADEAAAALVVDAQVALVGYGYTDQDVGDAYGVKATGTASLVEIGDHELFIAKPGEQQNCNGDSGGPALVDTPGGRRLVGVVSRSPDDDTVCDHGGIDTRVDPYVPWIEEALAAQDASVPEPADAGAPDGGMPGDGDGGGCGCRSAGRGGASFLWVLGLGAAGALARRRRVV